MTAPGLRAAVAAGCLLLVACGSGGATTAAVAGMTGECPAIPAAVDEPVEGLRLPPGATVTQVVRNGPTVQVVGYIGKTPLEIRAWVEGLDDVTLLHIEDEVREVETLFSSGDHRIYLSGTILCATVSRLHAFVGERAALHELP